MEGAGLPVGARRTVGFARASDYSAQLVMWGAPYTRSPLFCSGHEELAPQLAAAKQW